MYRRFFGWKPVLSGENEQKERNGKELINEEMERKEQGDGKVQGNPVVSELAGLSPGGLMEQLAVAEYPEKILESGCRVEGVPGFHVNPEGRWTIHFSQKSSGILIPIRNIQGLISGMQIRLDRPYDGRKYVWLSSVNFPKGASSGSPVHLAGKAGDKIVYITEGALKGDIAHAVSGETFVCVPGVNQYVNLEPFLRRMKELGSRQVYDAYDMDKFLRPVCRGDYNDKCCFCEHYRRKQEYGAIACEKKQIKRENIQRGCRKLAELCRKLELPERMLVWDTDENGEWAERVKGVDDYLIGLQRRDREEP